MNPEPRAEERAHDPAALVSESQVTSDDYSYWQLHPRIPLIIVVLGSIVSIAVALSWYWYWPLIGRNTLLLTVTTSILMIASLSVVSVISYLGTTPRVGSPSQRAGTSMVFRILSVVLALVFGVVPLVSLWAEKEFLVGRLEYGEDVATRGSGCYVKAYPSRSVVCRGTAYDRVLEVLIRP